MMQWLNENEPVGNMERKVCIFDIEQLGNKAFYYGCKGQTCGGLIIAQKWSTGNIPRLEMLQ